MLKFILLISLLPIVLTKDVSTANNEFAMNLLNSLSDNDQNVFFSPLSIGTALKMVLAGARGETLNELKDVLGYKDEANVNTIHADIKKVMDDINNKDDEKVIFKMANQLLVQKGHTLKKEFSNLIRNNYKSQINAVNFEDPRVVNRINRWVANETDDKISKLLDETLSSDTIMMILNAVYFKGQWKFPFNTKDTTPMTFNNFGVPSSNNVNFMFIKKKFNYIDVPNLKAEILEVPYTDSYDFYIVLPKEIDGVDSVIQSLNTDNLQEAIETMKKDKNDGKNINLYLPKFKLETEYELKDVLEDLGVKSLFEDNADLSGINGKKNLKVSSGIHKAYVDVNEEGTEAAAGTGIQITKLSYIPSTEFKADHPFLFLIRDNRNGIISFVGVVRSLADDGRVSWGLI